MSLDEKLDYKGYNFRFNEDDRLAIKSIDEINHSNKILKEESPEFDYDSCSWYLSAKKAQELKYKKLKIEFQVSWHGGLPFYKLYKLDVVDGHKLGREDDVLYSIAEFYLQEYGDFKPNAEGLTLHDTFKNISQEKGVRIKSRIPIKVGDFDVAYEEYETFGSGHESLIFLYDDVKNMSDEEIKELAKIVPRADLCGKLSIRRIEQRNIVYVSFCFHRITRPLDVEKW